MNMKIQIPKGEFADSRSCDFSKVTKEELKRDTISHIKDVENCLMFFSERLKEAGKKHDRTKLSHLDDFFNDFKTNFKTTKWYEMHQDKERHHLRNDKYVQDDVNLIDILELISDEVSAAHARNGGDYKKREFSGEMLKKAVNNTIDLLLKNVEVAE